MKLRVCLVALVKDEEPVIRRCLEALKPYVTSWVIFDTGSTDATMQVVRETMEGVPGELLERPFEGFAKSRTELMRVAMERGDADYLMMIDADDTWTPDPGFEWPELDADLYDVKLVMGGSSWHRPQLTKASKPWRYEGAAHEWLECDEPYRKGGRLPHVHVRCGWDGARRRKDPIKKYERVAAILEGELEKNPQDTRSLFYLAQSYRDARQSEKALETYQRCAEAGGWAEEVWYSLLQIAVLKQRLRHDLAEVKDAYEKAFAYRPTRAEPLVALARRMRNQKDWARAFIYASAATSLPLPTEDRLYVDESVYEWRAIDEFGIAAYWVNQRDQSYAAALRLCCLDGEGISLPPADRDRIEENLGLCLPERPTLASPVTKGDRVTVVLPTYACPSPEKLRRAVESVLGQTYGNLTCVVVSDGDPEPPWDALADIRDSRLVLHHVPENRGQFFAMDAVLRATPDTMFAVQDDDDVSAPDRLKHLVNCMVSQDADVVFCHVEKRVEGQRGRTRYVRPSDLVRYPRAHLVHVAPHMGLFKTQAVLRVGGYAGPVRLGYDTMVVDLVARLGRAAFVHRVLYHQYQRHGSMTMSPDTDMRSAAREDAFARLKQLWLDVVSDEDPVAAASRLTEVDEDARAARSHHVERLSAVLSPPAQRTA